MLAVHAAEPSTANRSWETPPSVHRRQLPRSHPTQQMHPSTLPRLDGKCNLPTVPKTRLRSESGVGTWRCGSHIPGPRGGIQPAGIRFPLIMGNHFPAHSIRSGRQTSSPRFSGQPGARTGVWPFPSELRSFCQQVSRRYTGHWSRRSYLATYP